MINHWIQKSIKELDFIPDSKYNRFVAKNLCGEHFFIKPAANLFLVFKFFANGKWKQRMSGSLQEVLNIANQWNNPDYDTWPISDIELAIDKNTNITCNINQCVHYSIQYDILRKTYLLTRYMVASKPSYSQEGTVYLAINTMIANEHYRGNL